MSLKKILSTGLFAISISGMSILAHGANSLTIVNNTAQDSTAIINNGGCSASVLGEKGITRAGKQNTIDSFIIWYACYASPANCKADVYMTSNCTGEKIATVVFDTNTGIKSISMLSNDYAFIGTGFSVHLNGGKQTL